MGSAAMSFTSLSQPVLMRDLWSTWSADLLKAFGDLEGAGYRVRTDDIQLGKITNDGVIPERNAWKPFTEPSKMGPSPTVKGFDQDAPKSDDATGFGAGSQEEGDGDDDVADGELGEITADQLESLREGFRDRFAAAFWRKP